MDSDEEREILSSSLSVKEEVVSVSVSQSMLSFFGSSARRFRQNRAIVMFGLGKYQWWVGLFLSVFVWWYLNQTVLLFL